jgi:hypothetical protein
MLSLLLSKLAFLVVQKLLGHSTISQAMDTYSHVLPGMGDQTVIAMESALI